MGQILWLWRLEAALPWPRSEAAVTQTFSAMSECWGCCSRERFATVWPRTSLWPPRHHTPASRQSWGPAWGARWPPGCWKCVRRRPPVPRSSVWPSPISTDFCKIAKLPSKSTNMYFIQCLQKCFARIICSQGKDQLLSKVRDVLKFKWETSHPFK